MQFSTLKSNTSYHGNLLEINTFFSLLYDLREQLAFFNVSSLISHFTDLVVKVQYTGNCLLKVIPCIFDPVMPFLN